ncbi:MAG: TonB-dependent receptor [Nitrospirae bacterium]|nr:TonB-dependent receptor [Nitrospirota bacterium]
MKFTDPSFLNTLKSVQDTSSIRFRAKSMSVLIVSALFIVAVSLLSFSDVYSQENTNPYEMADIVVTATRYEESLLTVPTNVTVITEEEIKNSTALNIPELLKTEAGVFVNDITGNRRNITVDLRGFGETGSLNTLVLVDGRRVNEADLSGTDWTQIPLDRVKRIEIIRGARASILFGDNATGGVINIITKEGTALRYGFSAGAGSYDTQKGSAFLSGSTEKFSYYLSGSFLTSDGYRRNSKTDAKDLGFKLNYFPSDRLKLGISAGYHKDDTGLPGALTETQLRSGTARTDTKYPRDFSRVEDYYVKTDAEYTFLKESFFKTDLSFRRRSVLSFASFVGGNFLGDTRIDTIGISPQVVLNQSLGNMKNTLNIGLDFYSNEEDIENKSIFFGSPSKGNYTLKKRNLGYYIYDDFRPLSNLTISAGYRFDRARFIFDPSTPDRITHDEELYTAGINYHFQGRSYLYASYSKGFRYPVLDEMYSFFVNTIDTTLKPQRSDDYEMGIRYYFNNSIYVHANLFRIDTRDEIFYNSLAFSNENLDGKTRREGVELQFHGNLTKWLTFGSSYTFTKAKIKGGDFDGRRIPNVPESKITAQMIINPIQNLILSLEGIYVGERPFISDFNNSYGNQEDYTVFNLRIRYKWKKVTIYGDIKNITDEEYSEYGVIKYPGLRAVYPSPKRNYFVGLTMEL